MATVIVPAHNEATVIRRCLDSLVGQAGLDTLVVACNGCTDGTPDIVRTHYPQAICLELPEPSKVAALNAAEQYITSWPVFYVDADTALAAHTIQTVCAALQANPHILLAAPEPVVDTCLSAWAVRQFYRIWLQLPYIRAGVIGTCSYVLTQTGRQRFDAFPTVINDDGFVRCQFASHERCNIAGTQIHIQAPRDWWSLVKIKSRARLGNRQLAALGLCRHHDKKPYSRILLRKLLSRDIVPALAYLFTTGVIRLRAAWQFRQLKHYRWEKDQSSRQHNRQ